MLLSSRSYISPNPSLFQLIYTTHTHTHRVLEGWACSVGCGGWVEVRLGCLTMVGGLCEEGEEQDHLLPLLSTINVRPVPYSSHAHSLTHVCYYSLAVLSCGFKPSVSPVMFSYSCCWCCGCCLCFSQFVLFAGASDGFPPGFPTEAVGCILFSLKMHRLTVWFCLVFFI